MRGYEGLPIWSIMKGSLNLGFSLQKALVFLVFLVFLILFFFFLLLLLLLDSAAMDGNPSTPEKGDLTPVSPPPGKRRKTGDGGFKLPTKNLEELKGILPAEYHGHLEDLELPSFDTNFVGSYIDRYAITDAARTVKSNSEELKKLDPESEFPLNQWSHPPGPSTFWLFGNPESGASSVARYAEYLEREAREMRRRRAIAFASKVAHHDTLPS